ncbi:zinc finger BED domain-containing protein 1-like isoform X1 [Centruroides sculpturatus]|uniref:zinc finger BED domain-containing protein 1-like isoform X1 n=1 Tax=Centruroides sculpturatus TaxID=218467 RepID=UPI000C6E0858|nr:zinc finger BED domain-containing protein 1-like isoform X1 [Centruroides sculpturatus]
MLPNLYSESVNNLKSILSQVKNVGVTTDIWTSVSNQTYLTVTAHFIHDDEMHARVLCTRKLINTLTAENIGSVLSTILKEWDVFDKVVTVVSDDKANIKSAIIDYLKKHHHSCVVHTLNLSINEAINLITELNTVIKKCRGLVRYFKHSVLFIEKLKKVQVQMGYPILKVKQDVATCWNSSLIMIERLMEIKDALSVVITDLPKARDFLNEEEWNILKDCVAIMKPLQHLTTLLSGEMYPTMSSVVPLFRGLHHLLKNIKPETPVGEKLKNELIITISRRFGFLETNKIVAKSTFLDPRYKKIGFGVPKNSDEAQTWINEEMSDLLRESDIQIVKNQEQSTSTRSFSTNTNAVWEYFDDKVAQVKSNCNRTSIGILMIRQYLEMTYLQRSKNPLEFWKNHKQIFPELYQLAIKYLCIPGTSVPPERVFFKRKTTDYSPKKAASAKKFRFYHILK